MNAASYTPLLTTTTTTTTMITGDLPTNTLLFFTAACLIPALIVAVSHTWRGRETQAHAVLLAGLRMVALGCGGAGRLASGAARETETRRDRSGCFVAEIDGLAM
ncbi:hypothetical protein F4820DRAFT_443879 [Hypoxylon rubiginosum]|uniref:Uncharacterized protein n=1 Tax=Hypoxylon rubiginosum TaxID=110542 RepID=A0ACB9ZEP1_9PEZI|nr:hypothetical protein F4820DRAFT_443879 [Hypoxylon rubiginosum]